MKWNGLPVVIIGTGGMAKEAKCLIDEINSNTYINQFNFLGFVSESEEELGREFVGSKVIASENNICDFLNKYNLIGIIIASGFPKVKEKIFNKYREFENVVFPNLISPRANIINMSSIKIGIGNIIVAGAHLTTDISIGDFNLINMNASIGHDVVIENYCVINPQVAVSGEVIIKSSVLVGAGVSIKQGITIEKNSTIGLGAFIVKDVHEGTTMICDSAKIMRPRY